MDLSAELDELGRGLARQRRLIELTVNRLQLAAMVLASDEVPPERTSLTEVHRVLNHLHHEEMFRAVLVAGIGYALGTSIEPDLSELIACAPRAAAARLGERRDRLVGAIDAADLLATRLRQGVADAVGAARPAPPVHGTLMVEVDPDSQAAGLARLAGRVVQPSLRRFVRPDD